MNKKDSLLIILAEAGIHKTANLDSRFRGNDNPELLLLRSSLKG